MMRRIAFALLAVVLGASLAAADDVKKDVKKGAQETKEGTKDAAKAVEREVKDDVHGAFHEATGTIKSVSASSFVLTDDTGKDLIFEVDKGTTVYAKGASHKMDTLKADGRPAEITEFLSVKQHVSVRYSKPEDRMVAKDIRVKH